MTLDRIQEQVVKWPTLRKTLLGLLAETIHK